VRDGAIKTDVASQAEYLVVVVAAEIKHSQNAKEALEMLLWWIVWAMHMRHKLRAQCF
jgi:hypothetical protein